MRSSKLDTTREEKERKTDGHLEEDDRGREEIGWEDVERARLACSGPRCLETIHLRPMLQWGRRGLSK